MMKKFIIVMLLAVFNIAAYAQEKTEPAKDILEKAYTKTINEGKGILIIFRASWCGWCRKMDSSLNNPLCKQFFLDNYITVHLTVFENEKNKASENEGAEQVLKAYNASDAGIPFWVIFNKQGNIAGNSFIKNKDSVQNNTGCPATEEEVTAFINVLQKSSNITAEQAAIVHDVFRKNE